MARSVCCSPYAAKLSPPLKTWPSFDAEGVGTAFWRLVEAFVLMNGRRGQRGDVIGQTGTRVRRWCRRYRAPSGDRLLRPRRARTCLSGYSKGCCRRNRLTEIRLAVLRSISNAILEIAIQFYGYATVRLEIVGGRLRDPDFYSSMPYSHRRALRNVGIKKPCLQLLRFTYGNCCEHTI